MKKILLLLTLGLCALPAFADWTVEVSNTAPAAVVVPAGQGVYCNLSVSQTVPLSAGRTAYAVWVGSSSPSGGGAAMGPADSYTFNCAGGVAFAAGATVGWLQATSPGTFLFSVSGTYAPAAQGSSLSPAYAVGAPVHTVGTGQADLTSSAAAVASDGNGDGPFTSPWVVTIEICSGNQFDYADPSYGTVTFCAPDNNSTGNVQAITTGAPIQLDGELVAAVSFGHTSGYTTGDKFTITETWGALPTFSFWTIFNGVENHNAYEQHNGDFNDSSPDYFDVQAPGIFLSHSSGLNCSNAAICLGGGSPTVEAPSWAPDVALVSATGNLFIGPTSFGNNTGSGPGPFTSCTGLNNAGAFQGGCDVAQGSSDQVGEIWLTGAASGTSTTGNVTLSFSSTYTTNMLCTATPVDDAGSVNWNAGATVVLGKPNNTTLSINWSNNGVAMPNGAGGPGVGIIYHCFPALTPL